MPANHNETNDGLQLGRPLAYSAARLTPAAGATVTASDVFADYLAWCTAHGRIALREGVFRAELQRVAGLAGITVHKDGTSLVYLDVTLTSATPGGCLPPEPPEDI